MFNQLKGQIQNLFPTALPTAKCATFWHPHLDIDFHIIGRLLLFLSPPPPSSGPLNHAALSDLAPSTEF